MFGFHSKEYHEKIAEIINASNDARYAMTTVHNDAIDFIKELERMIQSGDGNTEKLTECLANMYIGLDVLNAGFKIDPEKLKEKMNYQLGGKTEK